MNLTGAAEASRSAAQRDIVRHCPRCEKETNFPSPEKVAALAAEIKIDPSLAAEAETYNKRLAVCGECEDLREQVLCSYCGCFVLFRARIEKGYCPHPAGDRWG